MLVSNCSITYHSLGLDLVPGDFHLFSKPKEFMKGQKFVDYKDVVIQTAVMDGEPKSILLYNRIQALEKHWSKVRFCWRGLC